MFDLDQKEVQEVRSNYLEDPDPGYVLDVATEVQERVYGGIVAIGGITTLEGGYSTRTRRPLSASADFLVDGDADLQQIGEQYHSWRYEGAYVAAVEGVEVAMIDIDEWDKFDFPESSFDQSREEEIMGRNLELCKPEPSIASKLNRLSHSKTVKGSDPIDANSHIHWYGNEHQSFDSLAQEVQRTVEGEVESTLNGLKSKTENFKHETTGELLTYLNDFNRELQE